MLREPECKVCAELREERDLYRNIVLGLTGNPSNAIASNAIPMTLEQQQDWTPVQRGRTLSSKKKVAEEFFARRAANRDSVPATVEELTAAERLFNQALANQSLEGQKNGPVS